jgi:hypothetical protein
MIGGLMVTDRTLADYTRWKTLRDKGWANMTEEERTEWSGDMKGAYNASDLNRVGAVLNYLMYSLRDMGYLTGNEFYAKTDWTVADVPTAADLSYYLSCVATIRGVLSVWATTPATPPDNGSLDYIGANDIEKILFDVDALIDNVNDALYYSGDLYSGET